MPAQLSDHDAWRAAFHAAVARGHSPTMAAVIASEACPDSGPFHPAGQPNLVRYIRYGVVGIILIAFGVGVTL